MPHESTRDAAVTVVTRTKNRPVMLARALESVLAQTFEDWALVVVDDAGDRESVEATVAAVADRAHGRIRIVRNEVSRGREAAMNTGVDAATSPLVVIHDDDDTWHPEMLARSVEHLRTHPDDLGVAVRTEIVVEHWDGSAMVTDRVEVQAGDVAEVSLSKMLWRNYVPPISFVYRRSVHDVIGPYDGSLPVLADWDLMLRLLTHGPAGFVDGEPLARWHHRPAAEGDDSNSVFAGQSDHERYERIIRDRYLSRSVRGGHDLGLLLYGARALEQQQRHIDHQHEVTRAEISKLGAHVQGGLGAEPHGESLMGALTRLERALVDQNRELVGRVEALEARLDRLHTLAFSQTPRARVDSYRRHAGAWLARLRQR